MDGWGRGPAEPEETGYNTRSTEAGERKTAVFFDSGTGRVTGFGALEDGIVVEEEGAGDAGAYADGKEG